MGLYQRGGTHLDTGVIIGGDRAAAERAATYAIELLKQQKREWSPELLPELRGTTQFEAGLPPEPLQIQNTACETWMTLSPGLRQVNVAPIEPHSDRRRLSCQSPLARSAVMLAEIYMLRLEAAARAAKQGATSSSRFVPVSLPAVKAS